MKSARLLLLTLLIFQVRAAAGGAASLGSGAKPGPEVNAAAAALPVQQPTPPPTPDGTLWVYDARPEGGPYYNRSPLRVYRLVSGVYKEIRKFFPGKDSWSDYTTIYAAGVAYDYDDGNLWVSIKNSGNTDKLIHKISSFDGTELGSIPMPRLENAYDYADTIWALDYDPEDHALWGVAGTECPGPGVPCYPVIYQLSAANGAIMKRFVLNATMKGTCALAVYRDNTGRKVLKVADGLVDAETGAILRPSSDCFTYDRMHDVDEETGAVISWSLSNWAGDLAFKSEPSKPASDEKTAPPNPIPAPTPTDTNFVSKSTDPGLFSPSTAAQKSVFRSDGAIKITIDVERVVGEVYANGPLMYPQELVNNGVVSGVAKLRLAVYDVDSNGSDPVFHPERDHLLFNGKEISAVPAYLSGKDREWVVNEFDIPIELVRFGKMSQNGEPPQKGRNEITIKVDEANNWSDKSRWGVAVSWASLKFSALAPVVMVHGNSSCGNFFSGDVLTPCGSGDRMPEDKWFIRPFIERKIPFDNSINMTPNDSIVNHAIDLSSKIPAVARKFGAKHVHIVAHSKGGLDVREFLTRIKPDTLGVYSLTTLSTPHEGSSGADYQMDASDAYKLNRGATQVLLPGPFEGAVPAVGNTILLSDNPLRAALSLALPPNEGTPFLRVGAVRAFNEENKPLLPRTFTVDGETNKMVYVAVSADANLDGSHIGPDLPWQPTISVNETEWVPPIRALPGTELLVGYTKEQLYLQVYLLIGEVRTTGLRHLAGFPGGFPGVYGITEEVDYVTIDGRRYAKFLHNDFAVSQRSAATVPINTLGFNNWWEMKANHATISSPETANAVINGILSSQQ